MLRKVFYSNLFHRPVNPNDKDYISIVKAEVLYQMDGMVKAECQCRDCTNKRDNLLKYYNKHILGKFKPPHY
jgi:hypothetical protein